MREQGMRLCVLLKGWQKNSKKEQTAMRLQLKRSRISLKKNSCSRGLLKLQKHTFCIENNVPIFVRKTSAFLSLFGKKSKKVENIFKTHSPSLCITEVMPGGLRMRDGGKHGSK